MLGQSCDPVHQQFDTQFQYKKSATAAHELFGLKFQFLTRRYILLSHVVRHENQNGHISNRVRIERTIANSLECGYFSPFHKKTLKAIIGIDSLEVAPEKFIELLSQHSIHLLENGKVAIIIDDLQMLQGTPKKQLRQNIKKLLDAGFLIATLNSTTSERSSLTIIRWKSSTSFMKSL